MKNHLPTAKIDGLVKQVVFHGFAKTRDQGLRIRRDCIATDSPYC